MVPREEIVTIPDYSAIETPKIIGLVVGNGSGSKVVQSLLDGHEQIYMIPAYPLLYFYPHWETWKEQFKDSWNWESLIDVFCTKHASVLDSRRIPGHNGLTTIGENRDGYIKIDEDLFRSYMAHLLKEQPIHRRTFLLAVHYAYALCNNEDISKKKVLVYHIHSPEYLVTYLLKDFPDAKVVTTARDPRPNIERRFKGSLINVDDAKLNKTDALIYRERAYYHACHQVLNGLNVLRDVGPDSVMVIKHEDLNRRLEDTMRAAAAHLEIEFSPTMLELTFDGRPWWGDKIYDMEPMNIVNPRVVSQEWQRTMNRIDWFVVEGLSFDYLQKYGYPVFKYKDVLWNRLILLLAILVPSQIERRVFLQYLNPLKHIEFIMAAIDECTGKAPLKDYTWNATYLYKWTYIDLGLWRPRWYVSCLSIGQRIPKHGLWGWIRHLVVPLSRLAYVSAVYWRFWVAILKYPVLIAKRWKVFYSCYLSRRKKTKFLPDLLEKVRATNHLTTSSKIPSPGRPI